jgi:hypothetical protein
MADTVTSGNIDLSFLAHVYLKYIFDKSLIKQILKIFGVMEINA